MKINIQREFYQIFKQKGLLAALQWLRQFKSHRFAKRMAKNNCPPEKFLAQLLFNSTVDWWRMEFYEQFRQLTERQKTKVGGFKGFLIANMPSPITMAERVFYQAVLKNSVRDCRGGNDSYGIWYVGRPNYRRYFAEASAELTKVSELYLLCQEILKEN